MSNCHKCNNSLDDYLSSIISRQDSCVKCNSDIRVCKNCTFYEANAHWECKEEITEHVIDKEKANFCDQFKLNQNKSFGVAIKNKDALISAAEALFKKK